MGIRAENITQESNFERGARLTEVPSKSEGESIMVHPDHYKKAALLQMGCLWSGYWIKQQRTSLITFKEAPLLVIASQPPQRFSFGVWYNSFSSADTHGMYANMVQIANQQNSMEIKRSGRG